MVSSLYKDKIRYRIRQIQDSVTVLKDSFKYFLDICYLKVGDNLDVVGAYSTSIRRWIRNG